MVRPRVIESSASIVKNAQCPLKQESLVPPPFSLCNLRGWFAYKPLNSRIRCLKWLEVVISVLVPATLSNFPDPELHDMEALLLLTIALISLSFNILMLLYYTFVRPKREYQKLDRLLERTMVLAFVIIHFMSIIGYFCVAVNRTRFEFFYPIALQILHVVIYCLDIKLILQVEKYEEFHGGQFEDMDHYGVYTPSPMHQVDPRIAISKTQRQKALEEQQRTEPGDYAYLELPVHVVPQPETSTSEPQPGTFRRATFSEPHFATNRTASREPQAGVSRVAPSSTRPPLPPRMGTRSRSEPRTARNVLAEPQLPRGNEKRSALKRALDTSLDIVQTQRDGIVIYQPLKPLQRNNSGESVCTPTGQAVYYGYNLRARLPSVEYVKERKTGRSPPHATTPEEPGYDDTAEAREGVVGPTYYSSEVRGLSPRQKYLREHKTGMSHVTSAESKYSTAAEAPEGEVGLVYNGSGVRGRSSRQKYFRERKTDLSPPQATTSAEPTYKDISEAPVGVDGSVYNGSGVRYRSQRQKYLRERKTDLSPPQSTTSAEPTYKDISEAPVGVDRSNARDRSPHQEYLWDHKTHRSPRMALTTANLRDSLQVVEKPKDVHVSLSRPLVQPLPTHPGMIGPYVQLYVKEVKFNVEMPPEFYFGGIDNLRAKAGKAGSATHPHVVGVAIEIEMPPKLYKEYGCNKQANADEDYVEMAPQLQGNVIDDQAQIETPSYIHEICYDAAKKEEDDLEAATRPKFPGNIEIVAQVEIPLAPNKDSSDEDNSEEGPTPHPAFPGIIKVEIEIPPASYQDNSDEDNSEMGIMEVVAQVDKTPASYEDFSADETALINENYFEVASVPHPDNEIEVQTHIKGPPASNKDVSDDESVMSGKENLIKTRPDDEEGEFAEDDLLLGELNGSPTKRLKKY